MYNKYAYIKFIYTYYSNYINNLDLLFNKERQIDDSWNLQIEITDRYDFTDYKEINEIIGGDTSLLERLGNIANNIAMISTSCNVVREYNVKIKVLKYFCLKIE